MFPDPQICLESRPSWFGAVNCPTSEVQVGPGLGLGFTAHGIRKTGLKAAVWKDMVKGLGFDMSALSPGRRFLLLPCSGKSRYSAFLQQPFWYRFPPTVAHARFAGCSGVFEGP